jgi:hypothetical protein
MNKRLTIHLIALLLAGWGTWLAFSRSNDPGDSIMVIDVDPKLIDKLEYQDKSHQVFAQRRDKNTFWLSIQKRQADKKKFPTKETMPQEASRETSYRTSLEFERSLTKQFPITALRELGKPTPDQLKEFGLNETTKQLTIKTRGKTWVLQWGEKIYGGSNIYARLDQNGSVYLLPGGLLKVMSIRSPRYMERRLMNARPQEVEEIQIHCGALGTRIIAHQNRHLLRKSKWTAKDDPTADSALLSNWVRKLFSVKAKAYRDPPPDIGKSNSCRLVFSSEVDETVELYWVPEENGQRNYFANSSFLNAWVQLTPNSTSTIIADLASVLPKKP